MLGASDEAKKALNLIIDSIQGTSMALYGSHKTQEEIDLEDAMAELDKEFPPISDNKTGG